MTAWYKEPEYTGNGIRKQLDKSKLAKEDKDDTGGKMLAGAAGLGAGLLLPGLMGGAGGAAAGALPSVAGPNPIAPASNGLVNAGKLTSGGVKGGSNLLGSTPKAPTTPSYFKPPTGQQQLGGALNSSSGVNPVTGQLRSSLLKAVNRLEKWVGPALETANKVGITEGLQPTGKKLGGTVNRITEPVAGGIDTAVKYSPIGMGGNAQRMISNPRSMLPKGMGKKMEKETDPLALSRDQRGQSVGKVPMGKATTERYGGGERSSAFSHPGEPSIKEALSQFKKPASMPTDAMTMTNKSLVKSIDAFLMRKGILQKTANKSNQALGSYQKLGDPVKRMVNNSATIQSPDVWSAGKKTTKTKE
jgi:hypothetical protein